MRCEIAASLLHRPRIVFLDEPTIGLDVVVKQRIRDLILELNREEGVTIFLTSHDAGDVEVLCKRAMVINHGEVIYDERVDTLKRDYMHSKTISLKLGEPWQGFDRPGRAYVCSSTKGTGSSCRWTRQSRPSRRLWGSYWRGTPSPTSTWTTRRWRRSSRGSTRCGRET